MRLAELRKTAGISQKDFGNIFGVADSTVSLWESGKRLPDIYTLIAIAHYFDVSLEYLLRVDCSTDQSTDPQLNELIRYLCKLSSEGKRQTLNFVQFLLSQEKEELHT